MKATVPFSSMITFDRSEMPSSFLKSPYALTTFPWGQKSERSRVLFMPRLSAQAFFEGTVSVLTPTAIVFSESKAFLFFSKDFICSAQTEVQANGLNERRNLW